jgi:tellurite resistance protein
MAFGLFKKTVGAAVNEVKAASGENTNFLEAMCAGAAITAMGDGNATKDEKAKALSLLINHKKLGNTYKSPDIEKMLDSMFRMAEDSSGRNQLARELSEIKSLPNAKEMCEDVYLLCRDIAGGDGGVDAGEQAILTKMATLLGVNPDDFLF